MFKCDRHKRIIVFVTRKPDEFFAKKLICEEDILLKTGNNEEPDITVAMIDKTLLGYSPIYKMSIEYEDTP